MRGLILLFFLAFAVTGIFAQSITINKQNTSIKSKGIFSLGELYVYKGDIYVVRTGATETDLLKFNKSDLSLEKERLLGNPYTQNIEDPYFMDDGIYVIVKTSDAQRLATYNLKIFDFNLELKQEIKLPDYQEMAGSNTLYTAFYKSPKTDYFYFLVYENAAPIYYSVMADKYGNNTSQDIFSSTTDHVTTYKLKDNGEIISRFDYHVQDKDMEDIRLWVFSSYDETVLVNDWILFRYTYSEDKKYGLVGWGYIDVQTGDVKQLGDAFGKEYNKDPLCKMNQRLWFYYPLF